MSANEEGPVLISNFEVLQVLEKRLTANNNLKPNRKKNYTHRDWAVEEVVKYLKSTPCSSLDEERYPELLNKLQSRKKQIFSVDSTKSTGFGLSEAEAVQVLNIVPKEPVDIHLLIDELNSRMPQKQQTELLRTIASYKKAEADPVESTDVAHETDHKPEDEVVSDNGIKEEKKSDLVPQRSDNDMDFVPIKEETR